MKTGNQIAEAIERKETERKEKVAKFAINVFDKASETMYSEGYSTLNLSLSIVDASILQEALELQVVKNFLEFNGLKVIEDPRQDNQYCLAID